MIKRIIRSILAKNRAHQVDIKTQKLYNIQAMTRQEQSPKSTKEKLKSLAWKVLGYAAVAVGAIAVINWIASGNLLG